jgi:DNA-binding PadR family transcriptional regulator
MSDDEEITPLEFEETDEEETEEAEEEGGTWVSIYDLTDKQQETVRDAAEEMGFENLAGLAGYLSSHEWNYYDAIKASCRE